MDGEIGSAIQNCLTSLQNDGHLVEAVEFNLLDHVVPAYYVLTTAEASSNLGRYDGVRYGHRQLNPYLI
jgi:aspartyl-tRNA(Asn)/glutamyl-tRNA(Gln) amidotransferase subunit A